MADEYTRGEMDISQHQATAQSVLNISIYAGLLTAVTIILLTLVFGANMDWPVALFVSALVGGIGGFAMKQGALYWVSLVGLCIVTVISGGLVTVFSAG